MNPRFRHRWLAVVVVVVVAAGGPAGNAEPGGERPATGATAESAARPAIRALGGSRRAMGAIEFDATTREIVLPAAVNQTTGEIEYALVHNSGKTHESLLRTPVPAVDFSIVLLLLNYREAPGWHRPPEKPKPLADVDPASQFEIFVRWADHENREQTARIERWIENVSKRSTAVESPWIFTGSQITEDGRLAAEVDGTLVALYLDQRCVANSPREGNNDDLIWRPAKSIPPKGTPVSVVIRPVAGAAPTQTPADNHDRPRQPGTLKR